MRKANGEDGVSRNAYKEAVVDDGPGLFGDDGADGGTSVAAE